MAIYNRLLQPLNGNTYSEKPYVDDIFDPLFNKRVKQYYNNLYGNPVVGTIAGYADMLDNAFTGGKGILGPGMGILSTFGRSMDKADDFLLGGLTEGVNVVGRMFGGSNDAPSNPFENIFVNDEDYTGTRLMSAAGNAMAKLAGNTKLDESDFTSLGDRVAGMGIDLMSDPGILGGKLARMNPNTAVGKVGQAMSNYDDFMANVTGNMAVPGGKYLAGKGLSKIKDLVGAASSKALQDMVIKSDPVEDEYITNLANMADDLKYYSQINPIDDAESYANWEFINKNRPIVPVTKTVTKKVLDTEAYDTALKKYKDSYVETDLEKANAMIELDKYTKAKEKIKTLSDQFRTESKSQVYKAMRNHPDWFEGRLVSNTLFDDVMEYDLKNYDLNAEKGYDAFFKNIYPELSENQRKYIDYMLDDPEQFTDYDILNQTNKYLSSTKMLPSPVNFLPNKAGFHSAIAQDEMDVIYYHTKNFLKKHPEGLRTSYLRKELNMKNIPSSVIDQLYTLSKNKTKINTKTGTEYIYTEYIPYKRLKELLDSLKYEDLSEISEDIPTLTSQKGFIPWAEANIETLQKTEIGRDILELANNLNEDIFKHTMYENVIHGIDSMGRQTSLLDLTDYKILNKYFNVNSLKSTKDWDDLAKELNYFDLKLNPNVPSELTLEYYNSVKQSPFELISIKPTNISSQLAYYFNKAPKQADFTKLEKVVITKTSKMNPTDFTYLITKPKSLQEMSTEYIANDIFKNFNAEFGLPSSSYEQLEYNIKNYGTRNEKTFFAMYDSACDSKIKNSLKYKLGVTNMPRFKELSVQAQNLSKKYTPEQLKDYFITNSRMSDVVINPDEFVSYLVGSGGRAGIKVKYSKNNKAFLSTLVKDIAHNVKEINTRAGGEVLMAVNKKLDNSTVYIGYRFNTDNLKIKKNVSNLYNLLGSKNLDLKPLTFQVGDKALKLKPEYQELEDFFGDNGVRGLSTDLAKRLGFKNFDPNYIKFAADDTEPAAKFWKDLNKSIGIDDTVEKDLDKIVSALQDLNISNRGQFGTFEFRRAHLGAFDEYLQGLSIDPNYIHTSTFTKGMLDNTNAQTYFDLFLTDNFKIKENFQNVDTLKKVLFAKDNSGKYTGNLNNVSLVAPKYNADGKLTGFSRYNKFSDAELTKAFENTDAVLLPDSVIGYLDRLCKKDARMSNKVYAFINKYLTVPFKFGTLANPGFLVGNIEDAYFKQAVEMSNKYGSSLQDELSNVAMSIRHTITLNNQFADILDKYRAFLKSDEAKKSEIFRKFANTEITSDIVMNNPNASKAWIHYLNTVLPSGNERDVAKLYTFLNTRQNKALFKNNNLDLDVPDPNKINKYNIPTNPVERMFYGDPSKQGFRSWGLFMNNPVSNKILNSSENIESLMRSSAILNDLEHRGFDTNRIIEILQIPKGTESKIYQDLHISIQEAINTMHAANFDYNNVSNLMNKVSYILPFPTFYLKNLAYWTEILVERPQIIDNVISAHESMWSGKDTSDEFIAQAKGRGAIPIGLGNKHLTGIVKQSPYNSMFGAFNAVNEFKQDFAYRTNPILRPITHHLQDKEDIKYRPYSTNPYERNIKKGDKNFSPLAYMFHQLNPYERAINTYSRTPKKIASNTYQLSDFLPSIFQPNFSKK